MPNPVVHFEIMGKGKSADVQAWYSKIFDWEIQAFPFPGAGEGETYGMVGPQEGKGIGGGVGSEQGGQPTVRVYIEVDDPQKYLDKVVENGGKVIMPVTTIPDMVIMALFEI